MTTLISTYNSDGCIGRCDARCHNAQLSTCTCICGGMNHGKGSKQAASNTHNHGIEIFEAWSKHNPETEELIFATFQLSLF